MELKSPAFAQGETIPKKYTCEGEDISPPLQWSGAPAETQSFVLVCNDPDAPGGLFHHWAAYDIPAEWSELAEGHGPETLGDGFKQAINDFGKPGYGGPCPPKGHGMHHYHFRLMALAEPDLPVASTASCAEVIAAAERHAVAEIELVGLYAR